MRTARSTSSELWLRPCGVTTNRPRGRLVCMPHAGGTAQTYSSWPASLPADIDVFAVQYPGRQDRFGEPLVDDLDRMVEPIVSAIQPFVGEPLAIFGHSMGAFVAYEVAAEVERRYGPVVDLLVVSGAPAPHEKGHGRMHTMSDVELIAEVNRVNVSFEELLSTPGLVEVLLPMIRADYNVFETYVRRDPLPVKAALVAAGGVSDPEVDRAGLQAWSAFATDRFDVIMLPGGHFYLADDEPAFLESLATYLPGARTPSTER